MSDGKKTKSFGKKVSVEHACADRLRPNRSHIPVSGLGAYAEVIGASARAVAREFLFAIRQGTRPGHKTHQGALLCKRVSIGTRTLVMRAQGNNIVGKWVDWVLGHHGHHRSEVAIGEAQVKLADVRPREIL